MRCGASDVSFVRLGVCGAPVGAHRRRMLSVDVIRDVSGSLLDVVYVGSKVVEDSVCEVLSLVTSTLVERYVVDVVSETKSVLGEIVVKVFVLTKASDDDDDVNSMIFV